MADPTFRRPLGLALSGGGAHGAWEAGLLAAFERAGVRFDRVWGFSAGALNAAAWFLDRVEVNTSIWTRLDERRILLPSPRHWPRSIFTDEPLRSMLRLWVDEEKARASGRGSLHIATLCVDDNQPEIAHFEPGVRWDGPLSERLVASCAIPYVFPRVTIGFNGTARTYVDGGVPGQKLLDLSPLADCADIVTASVVRPEETAQWECWNPLRALNLRGKKVVHRQMTAAIESVLSDGHGRKRRVFSVVPSRPLTFSFLDFDGPKCREAFGLGVRDAEALLRSPVPLPR